MVEQAAAHNDLQHLKEFTEATWLNLAQINKKNLGVLYEYIANHAIDSEQFIPILQEIQQELNVFLEHYDWAYQQWIADSAQRLDINGEDIENAETNSGITHES